MLSSVICYLCPKRDGLCSVLLDGQSNFRPHFTTEAPKSYKSTHMKDPKQLWSPSLTLLHRFPCIFFSVPSHIWCHLHHLLVEVGAFQSHSSHHSSGLSSETGFVFVFRPTHLVILPRWEQVRKNRVWGNDGSTMSGWLKLLDTTQRFQMCFQSIPRWGARITEYFPRPRQDEGIVGNMILHDPCTPPHLLPGAYFQVTVGFCSYSCLEC